MNVEHITLYSEPVSNRLTSDRTPKRKHTYGPLCHRVPDKGRLFIQGMLLLQVIQHSLRQTWTHHLRESWLSKYPRCATEGCIPHSALFEGYDDEFKQALSSLKGKLEGDIRTLAGGRYYPFIIHHLESDCSSGLLIEQRKSLLRTVEGELDEAQEIVGRLDLSSVPILLLSSLHPSSRSLKWR